MSIRFRSAILCGITCLCLSSGVLPIVHGQQEQSPQYERDFLIATAREIMTTTRYCALITTDSAGRVHARAMDPFPPEGDMTVWFGTNRRSRKVAEIRRHPTVTLYYFNRDDQAYVSLTGRARLVNNPTEKARRWKDEWEAFYPNRERDYLLIEITPERLEVVSIKKNVVGDERTWQPPMVTFVTPKPTE
jgi:general stress protein 26